MTLATTTPDTSRHPGLRLMEATAAVLRGAPVMPGDVVGGAFLEDEAPAALAANAAEQAFALSRIDEAWQAELWGVDEAAAALEASKKQALIEAARFYGLCG